MNKEQKRIEEKEETKEEAWLDKPPEKHCPFDKKLKCEDCRLFLTYLGGRGQKACVFIRMDDGSI